MNFTFSLDIYVVSFNKSNVYYRKIVVINDKNIQYSDVCERRGFVPCLSFLHVRQQ